ncbi:MAG TPA: YihY/virulence factor BrkB family protein [Chitinophagaceae bacterium]|nr:YihY/virulence factor BrkB family protein [Chitinophagaceae bacterium]
MKKNSVRNFSDIKEIVLDAIKGFSLHKAPKLSGSLAYSTIFSFPPMLLLVIIVGGAFYGQDAISGRIYYELKDLVGSDTALQVQNIVKGLQEQDNSGWAALISSVALVIGATGVFVEIQSSLNLIWGVKPKPSKGIIKLILNRLISFSMILSLGFILIVSLLVNTVVIALGAQIIEYLPFIPIQLVNYLSTVVIFFVLSLLFAFIFRVLPDVELKWKEVWPGAFLTTFLFMIGKFGIGLYVGSNNTITLYGAASSVIILLVWVYFSAFILFFGAEFTRAYVEFKNVHIVPNQYAQLNASRQWEEFIEENPEFLEEKNKEASSDTPNVKLPPKTNESA